MSGQKTMTVRMEEMLERLWKYDGVRVHYLDRKVLNRLIKKGQAKIENTGGPKGMNCFNRTSTQSLARATMMAPPNIKKPDTGGPYAKRRAAMEASGESYIGKTWGKVRVDLPREAREKKIKERDIMWKKLKSWRT